MGKTDLGTALQRAKNSAPATSVRPSRVGQKGTADPYRSGIVEAAENTWPSMRTRPSSSWGVEAVEMLVASRSRT